MSYNVAASAAAAAASAAASVAQLSPPSARLLVLASAAPRPRNTSAIVLDVRVSAGQNTVLADIFSSD